MISDSAIKLDTIYKPGTFSGLMAIYESNYIKFKNIFSYIDSKELNKNILVSKSNKDHDLFLILDYRDRYTTFINLTYKLNLEGKELLDPNLNLKIYHDARLIEANSEHSDYYHDAIVTIANKHFKELDRKWRNNIMLNKWLDYLIDVNHSFN